MPEGLGVGAGDRRDRGHVLEGVFGARRCGEGTWTPLPLRPRLVGGGAPRRCPAAQKVGGGHTKDATRTPTLSTPKTIRTSLLRGRVF